MGPKGACTQSMYAHVCYTSICQCLKALQNIISLKITIMRKTYNPTYEFECLLIAGRGEVERYGTREKRKTKNKKIGGEGE